MDNLIFVLAAVTRESKLVAQVDFEPDTAKDFRELPFDELAKRYLEPAVARIRAEVEARDAIA
jgi:hypothetical protein